MTDATVESKKDMISVIIPTHNRSAQLKATLESVLMQDQPEDVIIEFVIVDDGSDDDTREQTIDPFIAYINRSKEISQRYKLMYLFVKDGPKGPSASRNTGAIHSNGKYIIFLDSDDQLYDHTVLTHLYTTIKEREEKNLTPQFVYGDTLMFSNDGSNLWEPKHLFSFPRFKLKTLVHSEGMIPTGSFIFSRKIIEEVPLFDPNMTMGEDFEWQIRVAAKYTFFHIEKIILKYYRSSSGQISGTNSTVEQKRLNQVMLSQTKEEIQAAESTKWYEQHLHTRIPEFMGYKNDGTFPEIFKLDNALMTYPVADSRTTEMDTYYNHTIHKGKNPAKILWILTEPRMNRKFIDSISEYKFIFTFNPALSFKMSSLVTATVSTLQFPFEESVFPLKIRDRSKAELDTVLLTAHDDYLEEELELNKIKYDVLEDEELTDDDIQKYSFVVIPNGKYFNHLNFFRYARLQMPVIIAGRKGSGFAPNHAGLFIKDIAHIPETIAALATNKDAQFDVGGRGYGWAHGNREFSIQYFIEKFSSALGVVQWN